ncbi:MAG: DUF192 domain-containing protein [Vampirovibrionia bacterium]
MNKLLNIIIILLISTVVFLPLACQAKQKPVEVKTPSVLIGGKLISLEIADTEETRKNGLMNRKFLPENKGMLFIFDEVTKPVFWMKDCFISLDIIFLKDGKIVNIYSSVPPCKTFPCELYPSIDYCDKVLEVNAGFTKKNNVKINDKVEFKGFGL